MNLNIIHSHEDLNVDELNLCTVIHDNPSDGKADLFVITMQEPLRWNYEKFKKVWESLIEKGEMFPAES